ncbi:MAG: hypothetical protein SFU27_07545 [Thermonemataceae bacterium]|nr:hypothetical protein [Thermonemataceae bacterium]
MANQFDKNDIVSYETAVKWAKTWQGYVAPLNKPAPADAPYFPKGYLLEREKIELLLQYADNVRIYFGMDDNKVNHLMMVGVDKDGNDILPTDNPEAKILNNFDTCPTRCGKQNGIND